MKHEAGQETRAKAGSQLGGIAGWIVDRVRGERRTRPRLALVERINLAPRQFLALVEAEGRRLLVATSGDGAPAFYALDDVKGGAAKARVSRRHTARTDAGGEL